MDDADIDKIIDLTRLLIKKVINTYLVIRMMKKLTHYV